MRESTNVMKVVLIALAGVAFVAGFLFKEGMLGKKQRYKKDVPYIKLDNFIKPIDPALIGYDEIEQIKLDITKAKAITIGLEDKIYVAGDKELVIFQKDGKEIARTFIEKPAQCMTFAPNKQIIFGSKNQIRLFDIEGSEIAAWENLHEFAFLTSIAATEEHVFAADARNRVIWKFNYSGELLDTFGKRDIKKGKFGFIIPGPFFDVAIGYEGNLWAVNPGKHSIENYSLAGELISSWERASVDINGFCGCCNPTHFAILPNGAFVTAEKGIPRVKVHKPTGDLLTVVAGPKLFEEGALIADLAIDSEQRILVLDPAANAVRIFVEKGEIE